MKKKLSVFSSLPFKKPNLNLIQERKRLMPIKNFNLDTCYAKGVFLIKSVNITWELIRNAESNTDGQQTHEKMLNIADYKRNANQNYHEISPHTSQNGHH